MGKQNLKNTHNQKKIMNVIQVYQTDPFNDGQGGGVRYVRNLVFGLSGYCDSILFIGIGSKKHKKGNISNIPITKGLTGYIRFLITLLIKLPFINLRKYDIVHVHRLYFAIPFIILKPGLKVVCSLHGRTFSVFESKYGSKTLGLVRMIFEKIELFCLKNIDYLVPVSQDVVDSFEKKYKSFRLYNRKILPSMFDFSKFKILNSTFLQEEYGYSNNYVLFLGRLAAVKDIEFLIELWSERFQETKNVKLVLAGDGELSSRLHNLSSKLCNYNTPIFLGEVNPICVPDLISCVNLCVLGSKHEASPTIIKEALSSGIPIVTNKVGDVEQFIIENQNGRIVKKTIDEYEAAIRYFLEVNLNKQDVLRCSDEALKKCSVEDICKQFYLIYKAVC
ncbi:glycosyltransferase family 4 protein [bacterium]|nr:glycosyltransferase family 4 protein [bacterium]